MWISDVQCGLGPHKTSPQKTIQLSQIPGQSDHLLASTEARTALGTQKEGPLCPEPDSQCSCIQPLPDSRTSRPEGGKGPASERLNGVAWPRGMRQHREGDTDSLQTMRPTKKDGQGKRVGEQEI